MFFNISLYIFAILVLPFDVMASGCFLFFLISKYLQGVMSEEVCVPEFASPSPCRPCYNYKRRDMWLSHICADVYEGSQAFESGSWTWLVSLGLLAGADRVRQIRYTRLVCRLYGPSCAGPTVTVSVIRFVIVFLPNTFHGLIGLWCWILKYAPAR
jgi:hypothetical protein